MHYSRSVCPVPLQLELYKQGPFCYRNLWSRLTLGVQIEDFLFCHFYSGVDVVVVVVAVIAVAAGSNSSDGGGGSSSSCCASTSNSTSSGGR